MYPANGWRYINNEWYYFGADGYMTVGWQFINNNWYYFDMTHGNMLKNTITPDGYHLDINGAMIK